jgi:hypothetical protein
MCLSKLLDKQPLYFLFVEPPQNTKQPFLSTTFSIHQAFTTSEDNFSIRPSSLHSYSNMPFHNVDTFHCVLFFRDYLDGEGEHPCAETAYLAIDEANILRIFDGKNLNHYMFAVDPIPEVPLFLIDLKSSGYSIEFKRIASANQTHSLGRMRITGDFGAGQERLVFKFWPEEYNKIGRKVMAVKETLTHNF